MTLQLFQHNSYQHLIEPKQGAQLCSPSFNSCDTTAFPLLVTTGLGAVSKSAAQGVPQETAGFIKMVIVVYLLSSLGRFFGISDKN